MCHTEDRDPQPQDGEGQQQQQQQQQEQQQQEAGASLALGPGAGGGDRVYRLASAGHDCQLALWDVVVSEEAVAAAQQANSAK